MFTSRRNLLLRESLSYFLATGLSLHVAPSTVAQNRNFDPIPTNPDSLSTIEMDFLTGKVWGIYETFEPDKLRETWIFLPSQIGDQIPPYSDSQPDFQRGVFLRTNQNGQTVGSWQETGFGTIVVEVQETDSDLSFYLEFQQISNRTVFIGDIVFEMASFGMLGVVQTTGQQIEFADGRYFTQLR
jgi:hypothetical protein